MGNYFQCPECKAILKKTPDQDLNIQGIRKLNSRLIKCPSCKEYIDRDEIIDEKFDIKTSFWKKPTTPKNADDWTTEALNLISKNKEEAKKCIENAVDLDKHYGKAWHVMSSLAEEDYIKLNFLNEALEDDSGYFILHLKGICLSEKAAILFGQESYDEALECANEAGNFMQRGKINNLNELLKAKIIEKKRMEE